MASKLLETLRTLSNHSYSGNPKRDWLDVRRMLHDAGANPLASIADDAEQLVAFQRGQRIATGFTNLWQTQGTYHNARATLNGILVEDQLLSGGDDLREFTS